MGDTNGSNSGSGSNSSSSSASAAASMPLEVQQLVQRITASLQSAEGDSNLTSVQALERALAAVERVHQQSAAASSSAAVSAGTARMPPLHLLQGQSRLVRPGGGALSVHTPMHIGSQLQWGASPAGNGGVHAASVHMGSGSASVHSAASAGTARTPIMHSGHASMASDDAPFTFSPDKANKAPEIIDTRNYDSWRITMANWLASYGVHQVTTAGPRYLVLPVSFDQLTDEERVHGTAGYELHPSVDTSDPQAVSLASKRAAIEYSKCLFASQALVCAMQKVPLGLRVVTGVPSPNAHEQWRKLEELFRPMTAQQLELAEQKFMTLVQGADEDIGSYGARVQEVINLLAAFQSPRSVQQQCAAFVRGIRSLSQSRRDLLHVTHLHSSFELVVSQAREFEAGDVLENLHQRGDQSRLSSGVARFHASANLASGGGAPDHSRLNCHSCGQLGHISRNCPERPAGSSDTVCDWCGTRGHADSSCHKKRSGIPRSIRPSGAHGGDSNRQASFVQRPSQQHGGWDGFSGSY